jgi:hypothetical protein
MTFQELIDLARERDGLSTDDVLASLLPLFRQVAACHEQGLVAPLRGIDSLRVDEQYLVTFDEPLAAAPTRDDGRLRAIQRPESRAFEIVGRAEASGSLMQGLPDVHSLDVLAEGAEVSRPVLVPGWETWEHRLGTHDPLSDVASLGMLAVALAAGLDFGLRDDVEALAQHRANLFALAPDLHPVVAKVVARMVDPDRDHRPQDVWEIVERLETYRDLPVDFDLAKVAEGGTADSVRRSVLTTLRDRLFDLSRRNRLIWFRSSAQSLNLTEASVPLLLDARNIRPEQLFTWHHKLAGQILSGHPVSLGSVVRWHEAPYANGVLDTLISQARRDRQEYGQAQLRLVVAFLRWHDLKGERQERISSPLLLLPVELTKKRGIRDSYLLQAETPEAEVNPALRQHLKQLYGLELPPTFNLREESIADLHASLQAQIQRSEPAVELRLQERPRIELIHARAVIRLEAFQRRAGRGNMTLGRRAYAYSYRRRDYRPLGLQIFLDRVVHQPAPLATLLGEAPTARMPAMAPAITFKRDLYALDDSGGGNPYAWDLDLTALTLANFNYRTMSLVRDYRELLEDGLTSASFERLFSLDPRQIPPGTPPELPLDERYLVLPSDGSQVAAIAHARTGDSLVIQGPPGTGKSQTITNLIADYVARGKRVLFVCQKRAAIDVVHVRLRQRGLDELACLIHDSQADKKAFVQGLKGTYEAWLADGAWTTDAEARRQQVLVRVAAAVAEVEAFETALAAPPGAGGPSLRRIIERLIDLRDQRWGDDLPPGLRRLIPSAERWWAARPVVDQVAAALSAATGDPRLAVSPLRLLSPAILDTARPDAEVASAAPGAGAELRDVVATLDDAAAFAGGGPAGSAEPLPLSSATAIGRLGAFALPLARRDRASVLKRSSPFAETLRTDARAWRDLEATAEKARRAAIGWHDPLAPDDARAALAIAKSKERSLLRFFDGGWRRVRAEVGARFSSGQRAVPIPVSEALRLLVASQDAQAAIDAAAERHQETWGYRDPVELAARIEDVRKPEDPALGIWRDRLAAAEEDELAALLADALTDLERAKATVGAVLDDVDDVPLGELIATLDRLADPAVAGAIRAVAPALRQLAEHPEVARSLRRLAGQPAELEFAVCAAALDDAVATRPAVAGFDSARLAEQVARIQALLPALYEADAEVIVGRLRARFVEEVAHASRSVTGMSPPERERKRRWTTGRRELENEFRKVMRYRSIRDLASGETGAVVAALRPIWLMSPTSVSDTLPMDKRLFDVVVYDEASQIPVEEAVPAMHRAEQVVVVGDRMQLPPTSFFTARSGADDDPDDEVEVGIVLDGDSFLAQAAGRLPSTMLTWHYRSRYESLIGFSNAAFYDGRLATIPDRRPPAEALPPIEVDASEPGDLGEDEARAGIDGLLERPISFHRLRGSAYTHRTNPGEAAYVAQLVRELLRRETGLTIGVVAFSEAQQTEIERALEALAHADPDFGARYEEELVREDDDQVVGLFVKNLENVQGDERDVILMSVCYGPDADGRMVMNFGPINQEGGEKRLNVIFSRARVHMAIVSSIDADAITNTYNDGANTLRRFLDYAAALSRGDPTSAGSALAAFRDRRTTDPAERTTSPVIGQLAVALRARGLVVSERVGQSAFRVDLGVRRPEDHEYRVAVLIDHAARVAAQPLAERLIGHPAILRATGWRVVPVLAKDWFDDATAVVDRVARAVEDSREAATDADSAVAARVREELEQAAAETPPPTAEPAFAAPWSGGGSDAPIEAGTQSVPTPGAATASQEVQLEPTDERLTGMSVCFTGGSICSIRGVRLSREDQERFASQAGLDVRQSVSARLDILVVANPASRSTKAQRAAHLGVRRIAEPAFWRMLGIDVDAPRG